MPCAAFPVLAWLPPFLRLNAAATDLVCLHLRKLPYTQQTYLRVQPSAWFPARCLLPASRRMHTISLVTCLLLPTPWTSCAFSFVLHPSAYLPACVIIQVVPFIAYSLERTSHIFFCAFLPYLFMLLALLFSGTGVRQKNGCIACLPFLPGVPSTFYAHRTSELAFGVCCTYNVLPLPDEHTLPGHCLIAGRVREKDESGTRGGTAVRYTAGLITTVRHCCPTRTC